MSCGVGCRRDLDLALLWLWGGLPAASLTKPLAWKFSYVAGAALKRPKKKKKQKKKNKQKTRKTHVYNETLPEQSVILLDCLLISR